MQSYFYELEKFIDQAKTSDMKYGSYVRKYLDLKVSVSFGKGNVAKIPWVGFFREGQEATNGIYPVYLFYKSTNL